MKPNSLHRCETDHNIVAGISIHRVLVLVSIFETDIVYMILTSYGDIHNKKLL